MGTWWYVAAFLLHNVMAYMSSHIKTIFVSVLTERPTGNPPKSISPNA